MTLSRVEQLFALACSTTHEEEARTAALAGVRLMKKSGLRLVDGVPRPAPEPTFDSAAWWWARSGFSPEPPPVPRRRHGERPPRRAPNGGTWCNAGGYGRCDGCGGTIEKGDRMYVVATGDDVEHWCGRH
jgi:hypothetical protein